MQAGVLRLVHYGYGQQSDNLGWPPAPFILSANSVPHTCIPLSVSIFPATPHVSAGLWSRLLHPPFESSYTAPTIRPSSLLFSQPLALLLLVSGTTGVASQAA